MVASATVSPVSTLAAPNVPATPKRRRGNTMYSQLPTASPVRNVASMVPKL